MGRLTRTACIQFISLVFAIGAPLNCHAVGLGAVKVHSALGQPFSAEIEVTAMQPDEFARVLARVASTEEYQAANVAYMPVFRQLRITAERRADGRSLLNVTSVAPSGHQ